MAKKIDPAAAKAAKQKKMAIGLGVLLLGVMGFQGPKILKMFKPPAPVPVAAPATTTTAPEVVVPPGGAAPVTAPVAGAPAAVQPAVLVSSDQAPAAGAGQLLSFELFEGKDPFVQQVDPTASSGSGSGADGGGSDAGADPAATPGEPEDGKPADADGDSAVPGSAGAGASLFETDPDPAQATMISVNGDVEAVAVGKTFPVDDPVFVFVAAALDGKSVKIGIAGGEYADGEDTITLKLGKPLTLQNTADGSRYELKLQTVAGFVSPAAKKK